MDRKILDEWLNNLLQKRKDLADTKLKRTRMLMNAAFENANVIGHEKFIDSIWLPDENDRHVLAAAIQGNATFIITNNLKDFPKSKLEEHNIEAISPDVFILRLIEADKQAVLEAFDKLIESLKDPPRTKIQMLDTLEKCGLKKSVGLLR
ncbi:PIN domain-containing protein [Parasegetibacter sp. MAH-26]|uniref:PIN domain-containing protein n=2 Tax=Pinibacter aurantiacus TaxID=2851599 RepID=A0A9E2W9F1_9BACT|nr:PIN domain-containing protein [Pinibacter aurantiacus]